jgi:hypothetical protein
VRQFIGQDPWGFGGGDANLYRYVGNGPTNATDPLGLFLVDKAAIRQFLSQPIGAGIVGFLFGGVCGLAEAVATNHPSPWTAARDAAAYGAVIGAGLSVIAHKNPLLAAGIGAGILAYYVSPAHIPNLQVAGVRGFCIAIPIFGAKVLEPTSPPARPSPKPTPPPVMECEVPSLTFYHKGELQGGRVGTHRPLSTGTDYHAVAALDRPGRVHTFCIPKDVFLRWKFETLVRDFTDFDATTGTYNKEWRFDPSLAPQMNNYKVD